MSVPDESKLSPATRAALDALEQCTLTELGAIDTFWLRRIKRRVAIRTAAECAAKVAEEQGLVVILPHARAVRPPGAGDVLDESVLWTPELEAEARRQGMSGPIDAVREEMAIAAEHAELPATTLTPAYPGVIDGLMVPESDEPDELDATPLEVVEPVRQDDGHNVARPHVRPG